MYSRLFQVGLSVGDRDEHEETKRKGQSYLPSSCLGKGGDCDQRCSREGFSGEGGRGGSGVRWDSPCHTVRTKSQCLRCMLYLRL